MGIIINSNNDNTPLDILTLIYSFNFDVILSRVANIEKVLPKGYISKDGFGITKSCKNYMLPLIQGEAFPPYEGGVPAIAKLRNILVKKKLKKFII